jgi:hypothetical protein
VLTRLVNPLSPNWLHPLLPAVFYFIILIIKLKTGLTPKIFCPNSFHSSSNAYLIFNSESLTHTYSFAQSATGINCAKSVLVESECIDIHNLRIKIQVDNRKIHFHCFQLLKLAFHTVSTSAIFEVSHFSYHWLIQVLIFLFSNRYI